VFAAKWQKLLMKQLFVPVILVSSAGLAFGQPAKPAPVVSPQRALVNRYCAGCHNDKLQSGGFSWAKIDLAHPEKNAEQTEKVIRKLRVGLMPPPGLPRPDAAATRSFISYLETKVDQAAALHPNPGRPALHRLNRTEYANSIRDLLNVDIDVSSLLPPDDMSHGFDNMADVLTVSPALMSGYLRAASQISREAVGDPQAPPLMAAYNIPRVVNQLRHIEGTPMGTRGGLSVIHNFPADGEYVFKLSFYYTPTGSLYGAIMGKGQKIEISLNGERVALLDIDPASKQATENIKTPPIRVQAGPQRISAAFIQNAEGPVEDSFRPIEQSLVDVSIGYVPGITAPVHLHTFTITGPLNTAGVSDTPSRRKIFTCHPASDSEELPCAKKILSGLLRQAWRRPVTDGDLESELNYYQMGRNQGNFESGIQTAIQAMIADPNFVFRFERTPVNVAPGENFRISDLELASRLSYFLWSSAPDEELLGVGSQGRLHEPAILEKQVRRMLADPKSNALATNFAAEWLHLQNLKDVLPDPYFYPNFTRDLGDAMKEETELFFSSIVREDRNILDLLNANYTYVNEILAKHYGIPNVLGSRFRRVELTDPNRFGLLGQGSILTLTSVANRTSPVQRGKWVMIVLLGTPPPPPPPNVPPLKENADGTKPLSVRERMEEHRKNEPCHSCHQMMDPIGLALENFDATGAWRTWDSGFKIDAEGKMFDGAKLDGPVSLRQALLKHSDAFLGNFTENLLSYGLGRVLEPADMPVVRSIERTAAKNDDSFASLVLGVVRSTPFQMRKAQEKESPSEGR